MAAYLFLFFLPGAPYFFQVGLDQIRVPIGGNSWVAGGDQEKVYEEGLLHWNSSDAVLATYVRFARPGPVKVSLRAAIEGSIRVKVTIQGQSRELTWQEGTSETQYAGTWDITAPGYAKIELQGLSRTGDTFGLPSEWILEGPDLDQSASFVRNNEDNYFYWGRRGPSVHLNYPLAGDVEAEWFYNEVTVPEGQDVVGSYFMANGFAEGYFGMQVNSDSERRILFSVWSPFKTDDPTSIPKDQQIRMIRKGAEVYTGEFGNEGAGGQSYLKYNWQAGNTYRFLLQGTPTSDSTTTYTAYFFAPEQGQWQLIASFRRPHTHTYLKRLHSFLENFIPATGAISRRVYFANQWVHTANGQWLEMTQAKFSADATARKGYRLDYAGGEENSRFYLQNCGFFNQFTELGTIVERGKVGQAPAIDFNKLP